MAISTNLFNFINTNNEVISVKSGNKGYLKRNLEKGYATIRINKAANDNGYEIKIDGVENLEAEIAKWLGVENKNHSKKPNIATENIKKVIALVNNPKEMEEAKIKLGFPTDNKIAVKRLEEMLKEATA